MTLKIYDDMVMVYQTQTMRYGGLLDHDTGHVLRTLNRDYLITFKACVEAFNCGRRSLQVTLYGFHQDSDAIGTLLSDHNFYLQQPITFDYSVAYFNPQYLLRPGSEFKMEAQEDLPGIVREKEMAQTIRSQMLQVFDTALGPTLFSEVQVSKRLITDLTSYATRISFPLLAYLTLIVAELLLRYQKKALAMMAEKESGLIENPVFPALWVPSILEGGSKRSFSSSFSILYHTHICTLPRYRNSVNGHSQHHTPLLCLGGLLADVGNNVSGDTMIRKLISIRKWVWERH